MHSEIPPDKVCLYGLCVSTEWTQPGGWVSVVDHTETLWDWSGFTQPITRFKPPKKGIIIIVIITCLQERSDFVYTESIGCSLPSLEEISRTRYLSRASAIINDSTHPGHNLFHLLPSGNLYRSLKAQTTSFNHSFFPTAVRILNGLK